VKLKNRVWNRSEKILFNPDGIEWGYVYLTLPLSLIYCSLAFTKAFFRHIRREKFNTPIIGVSNLTLGGSGKTPIVIELSKRFKKVAIISRGYGRKSSGLIIASKFGEIVSTVDEVGDEAMLFATKVKNGIVIVSEDRVEAVKEAEKLSVDVIILDDSYSSHHIEKDELIITSSSKNRFCLPSGGFREKLWFFKSNFHLIRENIDFFRDVKLKNRTESMVLITAISKGERLLEHIPKDTPHYIFPDHYSFKKSEIDAIWSSGEFTSIVTTEKDAVKLDKFGFPLSILELSIELKGDVFEKYQSSI